MAKGETKVWTLNQIFWRVNTTMETPWTLNDWQAGRTVWFPGAVSEYHLHEVRRAYLEAGWKDVYVIKNAGVYGIEMWQ